MGAVVHTYFQSAGTIQLTMNPVTGKLMMGTVANLSLVEVTIDPNNNYMSTIVPGGMCLSLGLSLKLGVLATLGATILGTLVAFALGRYRFRGRSAANLLIFLPMATPEVVMGSSLLAMFVSVGMDGALGFVTIVIDATREPHVRADDLVVAENAGAAHLHLTIDPAPTFATSLSYATKDDTAV